MRGARPLLVGGGWRVSTSSKKRFSSPVGTRRLNSLPARAAFEAEQLRLLDRSLGDEPPPILRVPVQVADVHDVRTLSHVAALLFPGT